MFWAPFACNNIHSHALDACFLFDFLGNVTHDLTPHCTTPKAFGFFLPQHPQGWDSRCVSLCMASQCLFYWPCIADSFDLYNIPCLRIMMKITKLMSRISSPPLWSQKGHSYCDRLSELLCSVTSSFGCQGNIECPRNLLAAWSVQLRDSYELCSVLFFVKNLTTLCFFMT